MKGMLKKAIAPFLVQSKSEAIRAGLEDREEKDRKGMELRRNLEGKVEKLERAMAMRGERRGEGEERFRRENEELMVQLNEVREMEERGRKVIERLKLEVRESERSKRLEGHAMC